MWNYVPKLDVLVFFYLTVLLSYSAVNFFIYRTSAASSGEMEFF